MLYPFFEQAGRSVTRQRAFFQLAMTHILVAAGALLICFDLPHAMRFQHFGNVLLIGGIVEGALIVGWRLTQLPKSRSLETLLLSPVSAPLIMLGEQLVGVAFLGLLTLSSLPIFAIGVAYGRFEPAELLLIASFQFLWGCVTGFGLTAWAYEPIIVRKWGERFIIVSMFLYLTIGLLAAEKSFALIQQIPFGRQFIEYFMWWHFTNPFALIHRLGEEIGGRGVSRGLWSDTIYVQSLAAAFVIFAVLRSAFRLKGHYIDQNYRPAEDVKGKNRGTIGDHPLSWWAVQRVNQYPGRVNLYLAIGVSILYASYLVAGNHWPSWMGTGVFKVFERAGGVAGLTSVLVLLSAVPAAYQYGLWDSSIPERIKRLEVFLMTELDVHDYMRASAAAAWNRGRGYFLAALILWIAGAVAGRYPWSQLIAITVAGGSLVVLYFAIGFRWFAQGAGNTSLGFLMTFLVPLGAWALGANGWSAVARWLPPGNVYYAATTPILIGPIVGCSLISLLTAAWLIRETVRTFDVELRLWYDANHGKRA